MATKTKQREARLTVAQLKKLDPCRGALASARRRFPRGATAEQIIDAYAGRNPHWLNWLWDSLDGQEFWRAVSNKEIDWFKVFSVPRSSAFWKSPRGLEVMRGLLERRGGK